VDLYVGVSEHGHPAKSMTGKGHYGFIVRYRREDEQEWHEKSFTRLHVALLFNDGDEGKCLFLYVAWLNPRLQHGPWSNEVRVRII
jgi:hypothetical protein